MRSSESRIWKHSWMTSVGTSEYICMRRDLTDVPIDPTNTIEKDQKRGEQPRSVNYKKRKVRWFAVT